MIGFKVKAPDQMPAPARITCPHCRQEITLITQARAAFVACGSCLKMFGTRDDSLAVLCKFKSGSKARPVIPLGSKGRLQGVLYAVVGFARYKELNKPYYWTEYVLFNPVQGYAFLAEFEGHWNFLRFIADHSHGKTHQRSFEYKGRQYNLFNQYQAQVQYAEGEFFWDLRELNTRYSEYIAPPYTITRLIGPRELSWMLGEYMEPDVIRAAFGPEQEMPLQSGIGAAEPFSATFSFKRLKIATLVALVLLVAGQVLVSKSSAEMMLHNRSYELPSDPSLTNTLAPQAGPTFTIQDAGLGKSNLEFRLRAPVDNNWLALGVTLVNTQTLREYDFEMGVEYYSGYEDGSNWSEGSQRAEEIISALPAGTYQTILMPYREMGSSVSSFELTVVQDVTIWSNFWVTLALVLVFPAIHWLREYSFEKRRWMNSDYSAYD